MMVRRSRNLFSAVQVGIVMLMALMLMPIALDFEVEVFVGVLALCVEKMECAVMTRGRKRYIWRNGSKTKA